MKLHLHAPPGRRPENPIRVWKINDPAYGVNDAPAEFRKSLKRYLLETEASLELVYQESPGKWKLWISRIPAKLYLFAPPGRRPKNPIRVWK